MLKIEPHKNNTDSLYSNCSSFDLNEHKNARFGKKLWLNRWLSQSPIEHEEKMELEMEMDSCCPDCQAEEEEEKRSQMETHSSSFVQSPSSHQDVDTHPTSPDPSNRSSDDEFVDIVNVPEKSKKRKRSSRSIKRDPDYAEDSEDCNSHTEEDGYSGLSSSKLPHKKRKLSDHTACFVSDMATKFSENTKPNKKGSSEKKVNFQPLVVKEEQASSDEETEDEESNEEGNEKRLSVEQSVQQVLAKTGVSPESIIKLINNKAERSAIIQKTGFSNNYIMKLQRKVLRSSRALQLREPSVHTVGNVEIHVLFDNDNEPLFIKKELCQVLDMKGTTFSYWKKKAKIKEIDTSQSFRLMDKCRSIFGGRSTYTLYRVEDTLKILASMESSRQRNYFRNLMPLKDLALRYAKGDSNDDEKENEEQEEEQNVDVKSPESDCQE